MLDELDQLIVRCWSAVEASGRDGTVNSVWLELQSRNASVEHAEFLRRFIRLRTKEQIP